MRKFFRRVSALVYRRKLQRELAHGVRKEDPLAAIAERKRWAAVHKAGRARMKAKREWDD